MGLAELRRLRSRAAARRHRLSCACALTCPSGLSCCCHGVGHAGRWCELAIGCRGWRSGRARIAAALSSKGRTARRASLSRTATINEKNTSTLTRGELRGIQRSDQEADEPTSTVGHGHEATVRDRELTRPRSRSIKLWRSNDHIDTVRTSGCSHTRARCTWSATSP